MDFSVSHEQQNEESAFDYHTLTQSFCPLALAVGAREAAGLALRLEEPPAPLQDHIHIDMIDAEGGTLMRLGPYPEEEVAAIWRFLHNISGLPLMSEQPGGGFYTLNETIGCLSLGSKRQRRRYASLAGRRPRFLTRRKTGNWPLRPTIWRAKEIMRGGKS